ILNIIKDQAGHVINGNADVPADKKAETIRTTTQAMAEGMKENIHMSNLSQLAELFSGDVKTSSTMNPVMESIKNTVSGALTQKVGLAAGTANGIAAALVPMVFKIFSQKANDPNENEQGFNIGNLLKTFTGNGNGVNAGSLLNSVGNLFH
ncbi:MAG: hypothetical protein LUG98_11245, partial [Tannerellaceae bacterium]|nr:hypothetical protein [Tannerellaceae bacterium]